MQNKYVKFNKYRITLYFTNFNETINSINVLLCELKLHSFYEDFRTLVKFLYQFTYFYFLTYTDKKIEMQMIFRKTKFHKFFSLY